jgi:predicted PurR-regulated permease PerM
MIASGPPSRRSTPMSEPDPPPPPPAPPAPPRASSEGDPYITGPYAALRPQPPSWFRRFAALWGFAAFLVVVAWLFRSVLVPFIFAIVIAYILAPAVDRLSSLRVGRAHVPRGAAVILLYVVVLACAAIFFIAFLPRLSADFVRLGREAPGLWERAQSEWTPVAARWLEKHFPSLAEGDPAPAPPPPATLTELPPPPGTVFTITPMANGDYAITLPTSGLEIERPSDKRIIVRLPQDAPKPRLEALLRERMMRVLVGLEGQVAEVLRIGQAIVVAVFGALAAFVIVLLVAAYILIDLKRVHAFLRSVVPERHRAEYDTIVKGIDRGLNGVIRGQLLICLVNGVLTYVGLLIFQVKYGLLLAVIAGIMSAVPIFGTLLSSIPIVLLAIFTNDGFDVVRGLAILAWIIGVHLLESSVLGPKIMGAQAKLHPVLTIFALIAGASTYGVVGAVLAVPIASIIQTLFLFFRSRALRIDAVTSTAPMVAPPRR